MSFQDLCEVKDVDNIVLKNTVQKGNVQSNSDVINTFLGYVFLRKLQAKDEKPELKDYKLESVNVGSALFNKVREYFKIPYDKGMYRMFDVLIIENKYLRPYESNCHYTWVVFEMGGK